MSTWLSGSLGSVSHGLSSITGQISSFTKDVLKEGTEEVDDHQTELRIANGKVKELESAAEGQKQEWDRIRRENSELREQVEAAELQISSISKQYRELLQTKEKEVSVLKQQLHELEDHHNKLLQHSPTRSNISSPPSHFTSVHEHHHEESPVTDLITAQMEINQLSSEIERLQAQVKHWKSVAQTKQSLEDGPRGYKDIPLQVHLDDLRCQLTEEVDSHQSQLAALQNAHTKKLVLMRNEHELEVAEKEERIQELERQLAMGRQSTMKEQWEKDDKGVSVEMLQQELHGLQVKNRDGEEVRMDLIEKVTVLEKLLKNVEEKAEELQTENMQCQAENDRLAARLLEIDEESKKYKLGDSRNETFDCEQLEREKSDLVSQLDESLSDLQAQSEENEILQQKTIELKTTVEKFQQQLNEETSRNSQCLSALREQNVQLHETNSELEREMQSLNQQLQRQLSVAREALTSMESEKKESSELKLKLEGVQMEFEEMCFKTKQLESELNIQISRVKDDKKSLENKCTELQEEIEVVRRERVQMGEDKQQLETQLEAKLMELDEKTKTDTCMAMHQQLCEARSDLEKVLLEKTELERGILKHSEQNKFKEQAFASLKDERDSLTVKLSVANDELQRLRTAAERHQDNSDAVAMKSVSDNQRDADLKAVIGDEHNDSTNSDQMKAILTHEHPNYVDGKDNASEAQLAQLYAALQQYQQIHATYTQNLLAFQAETERLTRLVNERENELMKLQGLYASVVKQTEEKDRNTDVESGRLHGLVDSLSRDVCSLREEHETLARFLVDVKVEGGSESLLQKIQQIIQTNKREQEISHSLREHNSQLLEGMSQNRDKQSALEREIEHLKAEIQAQNKEIGILKSQLIVGSKTSQATVERSGRELDRLRAHLIEVEETYTRESVRACEREAGLVQSLQATEEKLRLAQLEADSRSHFTQSQLQNLQDQLSSVCAQRDDAIEQLNFCQTDLEQKNMQLTNLQMVLEQFSAEKEQQVSIVQCTMQQRISSQEKAIAELNQRLSSCQCELDDAWRAAADCTRLQSELERSQEVEQSLRVNVAKLETGLQTTIKRLHAAKLAEEELVDKKLIKNWLLGYLVTAEKKKPDVIYVLANIVNMTEDEWAKVQTHRSGWLSGSWSRASPHSQAAGDRSFSEQFVRFLQEESTPSSFRLPSPASPHHPSLTSSVSMAVTAPTSVGTGHPSPPDSPKPWKHTPQTVTLTGSSFQLVPASSSPVLPTSVRDTESETSRSTVATSMLDTSAPSLQTRSLLEVLDSPESGAN